MCTARVFVTFVSSHQILLLSFIVYEIVTLARMSHNHKGAQGCVARHRRFLRALPIEHAHSDQIFFLTRARGGFPPHGQRLNDAKAPMCMNGTRTTQDGSGNQTPLGGKFTRTCSRGEDRGAF